MDTPTRNQCKKLLEDKIKSLKKDLQLEINSFIYYDDNSLEDHRELIYAIEFAISVLVDLKIKMHKIV